MKINNVELTEDEMIRGLEMERITEVYGSPSLGSIMEALVSEMTQADIERCKSVTKPGDVEKLNLGLYSPSFRVGYAAFKKSFKEKHQHELITHALKEVSDHDQFVVSFEGIRNNLVENTVHNKVGITFRKGQTTCEVKFLL